MKILISPYSKPMRNGKENPKNYPHWKELVRLLQERGHEITQAKFGVESTIWAVSQTVNYSTLKVVDMLIDTHNTFISVDNFLPHLAHFRKKYGVVLWGKSDPEIFGYSENINLLKDRKNLRVRQFETWEADTFDPTVFVDPQIVVEAVEKFGV